NIVVYGADWCADCLRIKYLLDKHEVAYEYKDVDSDPAILAEMLKLVDGKNIIPTIKLGDGSALQEPSNEELLKKLGLHEDSPMKQSHDVVMIGAGPAALTAAIYTTREDIDTVLFERGVIGGLAAVTDKIDNYPGFPDGVEGLTLADALQKQAERFGAVIELGEVTAIHDEGMYNRLETTSGDYYARAVLIATGSDYKRIGVPGEAEYYGRGVHYCATCDGAFYRDKTLVVVGGGNSAVQEAIFLTRFTTHIDLLVRSTIKASDVLQKDLEQKVQEGKITVHLGVSTDEIVGENNVVTKVVGTKDGKKVDFPTDGVFVFVGLQPNNQFLAGSGVELDPVGLIKTNNRLETAVKGVFAAGDIRSGATMQIASAAGEGATAALMIREYLEDRSHPVQN
ncbi:MAG TPA: FAD-dependent oxidoreductase, partial [Patescibacteria group bacterium]|nr:FAD-dependent oxidoreductase [Patescibacteria group bacterium]